jgi:IclR family KDG regulon transcriptional repressor
MRDPIEYNVRAVERALQILTSFDDEHPERGVSEIAEAVGLHKATTHRILTTLLNFRFIERSSDGQKYRLGIQLVDLGFKVIRRMDLRRETLPYINKLVQQLDEAVDLSIYDHGEVLSVEVLHSSHALSIAATVGQRLPAHCTASGKLFLAHLTENELEVLLSQPLATYTKKTISSPEILRQQFEIIRQRDYAIDDEEFEVGIRSVSAPIRNRAGSLIAAISIPGPISRMPMSRIEEIAQVLIDTTKSISQHLGWIA